MGVVLFHTNLIFGQYGGPAIFPGVFEYGKLGVHLFFILSGFIILKAHEADLGNPASAQRYFYRRIARIYPIYWIYSTVYIAAALVGFGSPDFSWRPIDLASSYTLLPLTFEFVQPPLKVAWTLLYEVKFYLLFAIALYSPRWALQLCIVWVLAISFATYIGWVDSLNFLSPWNLFFVAGLGVYWASKKMPATWWPAVALAGMGLFATYVLSPQLNNIHADNDATTLYWFLAVFSCALLSAALADSSHRKAPKFLLLLGDASYSLYLTHSAVISASAIICRKLNLLSSDYAVAFTAMTALAATLFGVMAYLMVERPLLVYLRRYTPELRTPAAPPTSPRYAGRGV